MSVNPFHKLVAKASAAALGGKPSVRRYYADDTDEKFVDILTCEGSPESGLLTHSTLGLVDHPTGFTYQERPILAEIMMAAAPEFSQAPLILTTCALNLIQDDLPLAPGEVQPEVITLYMPEAALRHVVFTTPMFWEERLKTQDIEGQLVSWLYALGITEAERKYLQENGLDALEDHLEKMKVDVMDLNRPCSFQKASGKK